MPTNVCVFLSNDSLLVSLHQLIYFSLYLSDLLEHLICFCYVRFLFFFFFFFFFFFIAYCARSAVSRSAYWLAARLLSFVDKRRKYLYETTYRSFNVTIRYTEDLSTHHCLIGEPITIANQMMIDRSFCLSLSSRTHGKISQSSPPIQWRHTPLCSDESARLNQLQMYLIGWIDTFWGIDCHANT